ncbi:MAG TPA: serine hydrolase, partial [Armatimonadota bacterium]|nr:serine hydrolase [Armatimonadota bacterium]
MAARIQLPRRTPESQGIASQAIQAFVEDLNTHIAEPHSLMLVRHGAVIAEGWWTPYAPELQHMLFSLSKSFTSTAIGMAVTEGRLSVDDPVLSFFPEEAPADPDANLRAMCVRHLLTMSTGHDQDASSRSFSQHNWVKAFLSLPVEHAPGTHFCYNTAATYMLSAILQKVTGEKLISYLRPRLLQPLGITKANWESCPMGINTGGFGLRITTEAIARFGLLYLQNGVWDGRQIVPASWIADATAKQVPNGDMPDSDWSQGYGYQFWRCRHNCYRGDGAFGQFCLVMPEHDAVLAMTSGTGDLQAVLNRVWDDLLPALQA